MYLSLYWKVCAWEGVGDRTELQHIDTHSYGHQRFFPVLLGCSTRGLGPGLSGCWFSLPHLISNSSDPQLLNRGPEGSLDKCWLSLPHPVTNWPGLQSALSYIIVQRPPSCGRHKLHSFNPSTVKVIIYWSTGCTCYLQWCISYFDSPAGL